MISKARIKYYSSLKQKKYRDLESRFLIEGVRLCEEAFASDYEFDTLLYCPSQIAAERAHSAIERARHLKIPVEEIDERALRQITDTVHSQGLLGVIRRKSFTFEDVLDKQSPIAAIDRISDPGNLGVILRSASWFGIRSVMLSPHSVDFTNPKVLRASMGGFFHLVLTEVELKPALEQLRERGYALYLAESDGALSYTRAAFSNNTVLILGSEASGVSEEIKSLAATSVTIPRFGKGESLNLSVAAAILFAEIARRTK